MRWRTFESSILKNNLIKKLASETAVYGITHTLGRLVNFLLVPIYTGVFLPEEYGVVSVYYSVVAFAMVLLMYGMETAFFNFSRSDKPEKVFATAQISLLVTSVIFIFLGLTFQRSIAGFLETPEHPIYVQMFVFVLAFDTLSNIPLAWLRFQKKPMRFGAIRLTNIGVNIGLNLFFLLFIPWYIEQGHTVSFYNEDFGIGYIFLSGLISSMVMCIMLLPQWKLLREGFDGELWKRMWKYGKPLIIIGLAGIVNETLDRVLLVKLLPEDTANFQIGVYSAFYKLSMLITIFVQSFRFAAEPFFFEQAQGEKPQKIYAKVMHYFVLGVTFIFLGTLVFLKDLAPMLIRKEEFYDHPHVYYITPILLLANLFLGIMYNLNIWYKLNDKMIIGSYIAIGGGLGTIILNIILIPFIGILGSAIATLLVYGGMMVASYTLGQKHYPVPYNLKIIIFYIILAFVLYGLYSWLTAINEAGSVLWAVVSLLLYLAVAYVIERPTKNRKFAE